MYPFISLAWLYVAFTGLLAYASDKPNEVIVITQYWDKSVSCEGQPVKVDVMKAHVLAMMHYGADALVCEALADWLHGAYGVSMHFHAWNTTGACAVSYFDDQFCQEEKTTRDLWTGNCKSWHGGRINRRRQALLRGAMQGFATLAVDVAVEEDLDLALDLQSDAGSDAPGHGGGRPIIRHDFHGSASSLCTIDEVPEDAFDKTCVEGWDLFNLPKVDVNRWGVLPEHKDLCFAPCLGRYSPLENLMNQEQFDALFAEGGCAAKCTAEQKKQVHHILVLDDRLDCRFRPLPVKWCRHVMDDDCD